MRHLTIILAAFLLIAFESPLLSRVSAEPFAPDLAMVFVIYVGLTSRYEAGLVTALTLGLFKDAFTYGTPIGMHMEILSVVFLICFRLSRRLALRSPVSVVLLTILFSLGAGILEIGLSMLFDANFGSDGRGVELLLKAMLPQALLTAPFGPILFWMLQRLDRLVLRQSDSIYL